MIVKLLSEHHLEFLSLKGGFRGSSESTLVKMPNCWKSHAAAQIYYHSIDFKTTGDTASSQYNSRNNCILSTVEKYIGIGI